MSQLTVIKFYCDDEIRRVPMNRSLGELTYDELCVIVQRIWKSKLSSDINNLILKYVDDEGDQICLENDNDVNHALSFSSCLKIHIYDKETIPVNSTSLIPNLSLEEKSLESIKNVVKSSRDTLNKIIEQLEKIKVETPTINKSEKEIKPLSDDELNEFLGDQNNAINSNTEDITTTPAVADQNISSGPLSSNINTNTVTSTTDQSTHQSSVVQTPNSIQPTGTASQPPVPSTYNQISNTPQLSQPSNTNNLNTQNYPSSTTPYQANQNTSQTNTNSMGTSGNQPPYQKTNSYSSNMNSQATNQASNTSSGMYASAPPPTYGSSYSATTPNSQYGSTTTTSQYGTTTTTTTTNASQYGSSTATSVPPPTSSSQYPPPSSSSQYPPPTSSATSTTNQYPPTSSTPATNPSLYQRYPQTPTYNNSSMPGSSVPPPPQGSTYSNQSVQKLYSYNNPPYGQTNSTTYGNSPYGAYNNNQTQNSYSRPSGYGQNNSYY
jgi:hypothetical protein